MMALKLNDFNISTLTMLVSHARSITHLSAAYLILPHATAHALPYVRMLIPTPTITIFLRCGASHGDSLLSRSPIFLNLHSSSLSSQQPESSMTGISAHVTAHHVYMDATVASQRNPSFSLPWPFCIPSLLHSAYLSCNANSVSYSEFLLSSALSTDQLLCSRSPSQSLLFRVSS